jgi:hypothetical protein
MEWPELDGIVKPGEYNTRICSDESSALAYPKGAGTYVEFYYGFDGGSFNFGIKKIRPCKTLAAQIRLDPDRNGAEVGDLTITVKPDDELFVYGIYEGLAQASPICGMPPDAQRAGVQLWCKEQGDVEVWLDLERQFANGLSPQPLEPEMNVHLAIQLEIDGKRVTNFVNGTVSCESGPLLAFE